MTEEKRGEMVMPQEDTLFEISWEVANKVGGIHTVLSTKAPLMKKQYSSYITIGPYVKGESEKEFSEEEPPQQWQAITKSLLEKGIILHYGTWNLKEKIETVLIEIGEFSHQGNDIKRQIWEHYQIDSLQSEWTFDEPILWSYAAGILIQEYKNTLEKTCLVHVHEWMSGGALLHLKKEDPTVPVVFTTHATMLGRTFSSNTKQAITKETIPDTGSKAYEYQVQEKHQTEVACAMHADAFTTVSEVTADECEVILGKRPDVVLPNGIDKANYPEITPQKYKEKHEKLKELVASYFFPYYTFDLEETTLVFISGRNEFVNKGVDVFIEGMRQLNEELIQKKSQKTVIACILIPTGRERIQTSVIEHMVRVRNMKEVLKDKGFSSSIGKVLYEQAKGVSEKIPAIHKQRLAFQSEGLPPLSTHHYHEQGEQIIEHCRFAELVNTEEDKVKVIVHPLYINEGNLMFNASYEETIAGFDIGVFPSFYEPWGYTPHEAAYLGIPSVTSDLSGFGVYMNEQYAKDQNPESKNMKMRGVSVVTRKEKSFEEISREVKELVHTFIHLSQDERTALQEDAKAQGMHADWNQLIERYWQAHTKAKENAKNSIKVK